MKLIKKAIKSDSVPLLADGVLTLICQNINLTITEEYKEEIVDIITLLLDYKRHSSIVYYFIKAFECIIY